MGIAMFTTIYSLSRKEFQMFHSHLMTARLVLWGDAVLNTSEVVWCLGRLGSIVPCWRTNVSRSLQIGQFIVPKVQLRFVNAGI